MEDKGKSSLTLPLTKEDKGKSLLQDQASEAWRWRPDGDLFSTYLPLTVDPNKFLPVPLEPPNISLDRTTSALDLSNGYFRSSLVKPNTSFSPFTSQSNGTNAMISNHISSETMPDIRLGLEDLMRSTSSRSIDPLFQTSSNGNQLLFSFMPTPSFSPSSSSKLLPNQCMSMASKDLNLGPFPISKNMMFSHDNSPIQTSSYLPPSGLYKTVATSSRGMTPYRQIFPLVASRLIPYGSFPYQHQALPPDSCCLSKSNLLSSNYQYAYENWLDLSHSKPNAYMEELSLQVREFDRRVYRCNTCSSEFPNAQAFGGHMSSHSKSKKTKAVASVATHSTSKRHKTCSLSIGKSTSVLACSKASEDEIGPRHQPSEAKEEEVVEGGVNEVKNEENVNENENENENENVKEKEVISKENPRDETPPPPPTVKVNQENSQPLNGTLEVKLKTNSQEVVEEYVSDEFVTSEFRNPKESGTDIKVEQ